VKAAKLQLRLQESRQHTKPNLKRTHCNKHKVLLFKSQHVQTQKHTHTHSNTRTSAHRQTYTHRKSVRMRLRCLGSAPPLDSCTCACTACLLGLRTMLSIPPLVQWAPCTLTAWCVFVCVCVCLCLGGCKQCSSCVDFVE